MRTALPILVVLSSLSGFGCRPYQGYGRVSDQGGMIPATTFARYGREQAAFVAIGRSLAAWRMTSDTTDRAQQAAQAACFAMRLPEVHSVDADPLGNRLAVTFKSGWRAGIVPITDGVAPMDTPGLGLLLPPPPGCR